MAQTPWRVIISADAFGKLQADPSFCMLLTLGRITNALRFAMSAGLSIRAEDSPEAMRQRIGSFFYLSGLLDEALQFMQRLGQHFRDNDVYRGEIVPFLRDSVVVALRTGPLDKLRNQAVFHNDDAVIETGLPSVALTEYVITTGHTRAMGDVYHPLADIATLHFALAPLNVAQPVLHQLENLWSQVLDVAVQYCNVSDGLIGNAGPALGFQLIEDPE